MMSEHKQLHKKPYDKRIDVGGAALCSIMVTFLFVSAVFQGYTAHIVSTVSEWSLAFSFISFFLTYIRDFQVLHLIFLPTELLFHCKTIFVYQLLSLN